MTFLAAVIYIFYFMGIGYGLLAGLSLANNNHANSRIQLNKLPYAFFLGLVIHVIIFNGLQLFETSRMSQLIIVAVIWLMFMSISIRHIYTFKQEPFNLNWAKVFPIIAICICSLLIYWNGSLLPNIAWDSWSVWEGKSQQWLQHGLHINIDQWQQWFQDNQSIFNHSAQYPDGLSLVYYLPGLLQLNAFGVVYIVYLFAFAMMTVLLVNKLTEFGAPVYLNLFFIAVLYTTPFISNHLVIQGYADLWLGMYVLLIVLSLIGYFEDRQLSTLLTTTCFLIILPMLKLEGWVWLFLFILAVLGVKLFNHDKGKWILIASLCLVLLFVIFGGINLSLPLGDLIINHERLVLFNLVDINFQFVNITNQLWISFFWQNNWSLLWVGLPFLLISFIKKSNSQAIQITHAFFVMSMLGILCLFYFTEASRWAIDFTAINRVILQLIPCYIFLLARLIVDINNKQTNDNQHPA